jgi:hypothetical protein
MGNRVAKGRAICGYGPVSSPARDEEEAALTLLRRDEVARVRLFSAVLVVHAIVWSTALALRPGLVPPRQIAAEILSTTAIVLI